MPSGASSAIASSSPFEYQTSSSSPAPVALGDLPSKGLFGTRGDATRVMNPLGKIVAGAVDDCQAGAIVEQMVCGQFEERSAIVRSPVPAQRAVDDGRRPVCNLEDVRYTFEHPYVVAEVEVFFEVRRIRLTENDLSLRRDAHDTAALAVARRYAHDMAAV